jgi:hypothetical protein
MTSSPSTSRLSELIARLEAAKEESRELDIAIFEEVFDCEPRRYSDNPRARLKWWYKRGTDRVVAYNAGEIPCFTASLDAALTLVPEGWRTDPAKQGLDGRWFWALVNDRNGHFIGSTLCATPALALVIAALKARLK